MKTKTKNVPVYIVFFLSGITLTIAITPVWNFIQDIAFGFEIQSVASFPYTHTARLRNRNGLIDRNVFFEVDGKDVWSSGDLGAGDLEEKIYWDSQGKIVTFELWKKAIFIYDTESKADITNRK